VFRLDTSEDYKTIIVTGDDFNREVAARHPQATADDAEVRIPSSRQACLMLETIGMPDCTERYLALRRHVMRPTKHALQEVERKFRDGLGEVPSLLLHQWEFLAHHQNSLSAYNASEQGLGKTRMALAHIVMLGVNRILVVMPKDLAAQWEEELPNIWPDPDVQPAFFNLTKGSKKQRVEQLTRAAFSGRHRTQSECLVPVIVAVNYEVVNDIAAALDGFRPQLIITDEAWKIKNPTAKVTKAMIKLADLMRSRGGGFTLALAGTPIGNNIGDLWSQLRFLGRHLMPMSYTAFLQRYAILKPLRLPARTIHVPVGVADPMGLMQLLDPCWFRATKASCLNLPPKVRREVRLPMGPEQAELYQLVEREGVAVLGDDITLASQVVINLRLQQIAGGHRPTYLEEEEGWEETEATVGWSTRPIDDCPKVEWIRRWADTNLLSYAQTRCIVWCRFNSEVRRVAEELTDVLGEGRVVTAIGGSSSEELTRHKASFNSRDPNGVQVIVAQIARLAYGHNLQAADWSIYFSPTWSYLQHAQSEDRNHRFGRDQEVNYIHLIAEGTIDEDALAALRRKEDLSARFTPNVATPTATAPAATAV
jgi:SNF2 family DNA or RNA helicase